jgi:hypothetical protein
MRAHQIKRHIDDRIIEIWRLRWQQIEAETVIEKRVSVVPMVITQIPIGILPQKQGQRPEGQRRRNHQGDGKPTRAIAARRQKWQWRWEEWCCVASH